MTVLNRVIVFATGKGGTGKTSCATNVAGLAAAAGWQTLLIDLDPQKTVGHDLGYEWEGLGDEGKHLVDTLVTEGQLAPVLRRVRPNLDVVPGGSRLDDLEDVVSGRMRRGEEGRALLRDALRDVAGDYDLIIIDTPPTRRSALVTLALASARWVVVPTRSDRSSIEGLRKLGEQIRDIRDINAEVEVLGAVLFAVGSSSNVVRANAIEDVTDALAGVAPLFESVIRHAESVAAQSREKGRLVHELAEVVHDAEPFWVALREGRRPERVPGSAPSLAEDYAVLAQELLNRIDQMEKAQVPA